MAEKIVRPILTYADEAHRLNEKSGIGYMINEHKSWGNKFIDNLAVDIRIAFPESKGYSVRNLKYMAKLAETYPDREFVQQVVAQIPWGHNIVLLDKITDMDERKWYIKKSAENGWSRNVLVHQIESKLYQRQVLADKVTNFEHRLSSPQSELAVQTMKDPYVFDFIPFREDMLERDIEQALVRDVTKLLLELGTGFAFLGNHNVVAEYSLKDISKPIGVSEYKITSSLPDDLEKQLPSVEDIQKRIK